MSLSFSPTQFLVGQATGTIIAMVLKTHKYQRATKIPKLSEWKPQEFKFGNIFPISTFHQENYQYSAEATEHAVEDGSLLTDHVIVRPLQFTFEGEISNWNGVERAKSLFDSAVKALTSRELVTLITTHAQLDNMVCVDFNPVNEVPEWGKLKFTCVFKQMRPIKLELVKYPESKVKRSYLHDSYSYSTPGGPDNWLSAASASAPTTSNPSITK